MRTVIVAAEQVGLRLDRVVAAVAGLGLRGSRRMIDDGAVMLNGRAALKSARLRAGDKICLAAVSHECGQAKIIAASGDYCFFYKPAGLHTAALAGRSNASLEAALPVLCMKNGLKGPIALLQRLDYGTSGIVCGALTMQAAAAWQSWQKSGSCRKFYLAVLQGRMEQPCVVRNMIKGGVKKSHCLSEDGPELRWTSFEPLWQGDLSGYAGITIARCMIRSGVRHQIRVHAAACGYPLAGDRLYGADLQGLAYRLAHYRLEFSGHAVTFQDEFFAELISGLPALSEKLKCM